MYDVATKTLESTGGRASIKKTAQTETLAQQAGEVDPKLRRRPTSGKLGGLEGLFVVVVCCVWLWCGFLWGGVCVFGGFFVWFFGVLLGVLCGGLGVLCFVVGSSTTKKIPCYSYWHPVFWIKKARWKRKTEGQTATRRITPLHRGARTPSKNSLQRPR